MSRRLQVFVSSTYLDLKEERQAAVEAILEAKHIPAGMELFAAGNDSQLEVIKRWIDESDVYMLILGHRYGSIESESGKSYTQVEYEHAVATGKPVFAVVMTDDWRIAKQATVKDPDSLTERENNKELKAFRTLVMGRMCKQPDDRKDIKIAVLQALAGFAHDKRLVGWVRGDADDKRQELEKENAGLKGELAAAQRQNTAPTDYSQSIVSTSDEEWKRLRAALIETPVVINHGIRVITSNGVRPAIETTNALKAMIEHRDYLSRGVPTNAEHDFMQSLINNVSPVLLHHELIEAAPATKKHSHLVLRLSQNGRNFLIWHDLQRLILKPALPPNSR